MSIGSNITKTNIDIARYTTVPSSTEKTTVNIVRKPVVIPNNYAASPVRHSLVPSTPIKTSNAVPAANIVKKSVDLTNQNGGVGKLSYSDIFNGFKLNLAEFMKSAGVQDPSWIDIQNGEKKLPIKEFISKIEPNMLLQVSNRLKELSKDTNVLRQAHSITGENKSRLAKDPKSILMKVVVDIAPAKNGAKATAEVAEAEKVDAGVQAASSFNYSNLSMTKMLISINPKYGEILRKG
jgi:hypothetical protein